MNSWRGWKETELSGGERIDTGRGRAEAKGEKIRERRRGGERRPSST